MGSIFIIQGILIYIYAFDHRSTFGRLPKQEPAAHPCAEQDGQFLHHHPRPEERCRHRPRKTLRNGTGRIADRLATIFQ